MASFVYRLTGAGWSEATISDGVHATTIPHVSYLSDALGDLVAALVLLLEGAKRVEFSWSDEPSEYEWLLTHHKQTFSIRITWYRDWEMDRNPKDRGKTVLKARCSLRDFATAVLDQLTELYTTLGPQGYKQRWIQHDFPSADYRRLASLLGVELPAT